MIGSHRETLREVIRKFIREVLREVIWGTPRGQRANMLDTTLRSSSAAEGKGASAYVRLSCCCPSQPKRSCIHGASFPRNSSCPSCVSVVLSAATPAPAPSRRRARASKRAMRAIEHHESPTLPVGTRGRRGEHMHAGRTPLSTSKRPRYRASCRTDHTKPRRQTEARRRSQQSNGRGRCARRCAPRGWHWQRRERWRSDWHRNPQSRACSRLG